MIYEIIGVVWMIVLVWCLWEFYGTPTYPADWNESGVNPDHEEIEDEK